MDDIDALLRQSRECGITLWVDTGRLRFKAPRGALNAGLREQIGARKHEIIEALRRASPETGPIAPGPIFVRRQQPERVPIIDYHRIRWESIKSGELGVEFINSPHAALKVDGPLNVATLRHAVELLTHRHSILTARVIDTPDGPQFVFDQQRAIRLQETSLPEASPASRALARRLATDLIWAPFRADAGPWFRVFVISLGTKEHVVGFVVHHFIGDGWSARLIARELTHIYAALTAGVTPELPELPIQYSDYVAAINEWMSSGAAQISAAYWQERLRNAPPTRVPPDFQVHPEQVGELATQSDYLPADVTENLRNLGKSSRVSMLAIVAAALAVDVAHLSGAGDVVIVSRTHGRGDPALLGLVGAFFDSMALRISVSMDATFDSLMHDTHRTLTRSSDHERYPYQLVKLSLPQIGASDIAPMLNLSVADAERTDRGKSPVSEFELLPRPPVSHAARRYTGFYTAVAIDGRGLHAKAEYLSLLYTTETATRFVRTLCNVLRGAAENPYRRVSSLLQ